MTSTELITQFVSGGLLGMAGQTIRTFVGLTKANSDQETISLPRIAGSLAVGFSAGGLGIFTLTGWNSTYDLKPQDFSLLLSIGYAGTDFLEGFFRALVDRGALSTSVNQDELVDKLLSNDQKLTDLHAKVDQLMPTTVSGLMAEKLNGKANFIGLAEPAVSAANVVISFGTNVNKTVISSFALDFVKDTLSLSGNPKATITSSARTPEEQARAMFNNLELKGVESQKALYAAAGDQVIDVYVTSKKGNKSRSEIIADMTRKINELGPSKVSRHCADFTKLVVIDIAPSSIMHKDAWVEVLKEKQQSFDGFNFILPGNDPAYHLEIPNVLPENILA